jgi:hypothetical protein
MKYSVIVPDLSDESLYEMLDYCLEHRLSLEKYENSDVSDLSLKWDMLSTFIFTNEDDLLVFKLRFKT